MSKRRLIVITGVLACLLLLTSTTSAMESTNYKLEWFTPLTGSGGAANSDHYAINFTVGQSVVGVADGAGYEVCLGYWCGGAAVEYRIFLPLVMRNFS